ncbi:MAG: hypothetical protein GNW80_01700 [Asgard group archaeon]|nr:hypothetical protein [Asgard group archaeon]
MERKVRIFGPNGAGKTVYLAMLFDSINQGLLNPFVIDPSEDSNTIDYLSFVGETIVNEGSSFATPRRSFIELKLKLVYDGSHPKSGQPVAMISSYDLSGEDIQEIFDARYHSEIRKSLIPAELKESQKVITNLLYSGNSFIFLVDPLFFDFNEQDTMFTIMMKMIYQNKINNKKSDEDISKEIKITMCVSKGDVIDFPNADAYLKEKLPTAWRYGKLYFKKNFKCITLSSLGVGAEEREYPIKVYINPVNITEPIKFFIQAEKKETT